MQKHETIDSLFLETLIDNLRVEANLILDELLHIAYVIHFFSVQDKENNNFLVDTSLRNLFNKLKIPLQELTETVGYFKTNLDSISEYFYSKNQKLSSYLEITDFLAKIVFAVTQKSKILELMDYMQKKVITLLESFHGYYPSPTKSTSKGVKAHLYMEELARNFENILIKVFLNNKSTLKNTISIYWDFLPEVRYLLKTKNLFLNTDFFLPKRQSHWLILCHEVLHYLLEKIDSKEEKIIKNLFTIIDKSFNDIYNSLWFSKIRSDIDQNYIIDIVIDSLLTYILGPPYFIPISIRLFAFDEGNYFYPLSVNRKWFVRLYTASKFYKKYLEKEKLKKESNFYRYFEDFEKTLNMYKNTQLATPFFNSKKIYNKEEIISEVVSIYLEKFIKKNKELIKNLDEKLKGNIWIGRYINYAKNYFDYYLNSLLEGKEEKPEGRAVSIIFQDVLINKSKTEETERIKSYIKSPVYKFQYFKVRYDKTKNTINDNKGILDSLKDLNYLHAWNFGPYTFLSVKESSYYEKYEKRNENYLNILKDIAGSTDNKKSLTDNRKESSDFDPELELYSKGFYFYKKDLSLTLYPLDQEGHTAHIEKDSIFKKVNLTKSIYIFCKYQLNKDKKIDNIAREAFKQFSDFKDKLLNNSVIGPIDIDIFHFTSFDWFDFCTLILIKNINKEINLTYILKLLKEKVLICNGNILQRTQTDIFIGKDITHLVKVSLPYIHMRISSKNLGISGKIVNQILKEDEDCKVASRFGIRDLVISFEKKEGFFNEMLEKIKNLLNLKIENNQKSNLFSDFQFVVGVDWKKGDITEC